MSVLLLSRSVANSKLHGTASVFNQDRFTASPFWFNWNEERNVPIRLTVPLRAVCDKYHVHVSWKGVCVYIYIIVPFFHAHEFKLYVRNSHWRINMYAYQFTFLTLKRKERFKGVKGMDRRKKNWWLIKLRVWKTRFTFESQCRFYAGKMYSSNIIFVTYENKILGLSQNPIVRKAKHVNCQQRL
jgi:hypothetical protein